MNDLILGKYELFRVVTDYEGLKEAFNDRIEDLDTPLSEIDNAAGLTPGNAQKLLCKSDEKWARNFGWKTLGPMLKGTGLVLVLVVDDARFAAVKATLAKRRKMMRPIARIVRPRWLFTRHNSLEMNAKQWSRVPVEKRKKMMKKLAKARWSRKNRKRLESPAVSVVPDGGL